MGKAGGLAYRYGPSSAEYGTTGNAGIPSYYKRADTAFVSDRDGGIRPCYPPYCGTWQVGQYDNDTNPGGYSSNWGHIAYTPDSPTQRIGVSDLAISSVSNNAFSQKPELSWTLGGGGLDEFLAVKVRDEGKDASNPVAIARCYRPGWCMSSVMVFQSGLVAIAGSNTAPNYASAQLAAGKVPTAVAVSSGGEFAFITVWDTTNLRGEVAVVALAGICGFCSISNPGQSDYWGEWSGLYPGLPNMGNVGYMKVLGYAPLPAEMKAPTEISVTTGFNRNAYLNESGNDKAYDLPLSNAANRATFAPGGRNFDRYAKAGIAVVISKSEQRVAFVDLKPLFQYYQSMYFGTASDFNVTTAIGSGDSQWPRTFASAPQQAPTVIKTVNLASRPTAVKAYLWGANKRAWVGTQDGQLHIFNLGDYPTAGTASAASIVEMGSVAVGRNPTSIAYPKEKSRYPDITNEVIVTSRGDRKIDWVRFSGAGGSIVRTLQDQRMQDPVAAEDTENNGTDSAVLSVADFNGKQLHNYRYGPVIMYSYSISCQPPNGCGMGSSGNDPFEYGGSFTFPGTPFQVTGANIP